MTDPLALPPFRVPKDGMSLTIIPPFPFEGMTIRTLPLRASVAALQRFVDQYLNIIPPQLGRFRALAPYVQLLLVDYGRMATKVRNVGWVAQREILFSVPLAWYEVVDGAWRFRDWASIAPFIYVDDDMSMATGRGVYGWPKVTARLTPTLGRWMNDPLAPANAATVSTMVFPELYTGRRLEERVFLEVSCAPAPPLATLPPDPRTLFAPWTIAANVAAMMNGFARDTMGLMQGAGVWPLHPSATADNVAAMAGLAGRMAFPMRPNLAGNTINLKQFHRSEKPADYCFQAVTNGAMRLTAFHGGGLLGEQRQMLGDLTGGYRITLHEWPSLPIVETLGIEVAARWRGDGCNAVELHPVMPSWCDVDMEYLRGVNIAWRERDALWRAPDGAFVPQGDDVPDPVTNRMYNTTLGASQAAVAGPFRLSNTTIRVLPLLAMRDRLDTFIATYLNAALAPAGERFRLWGPADSSSPFGYVYLTVETYGDVSSPTNNIGDWASCALSYLVPVRRERFVADAKGEERLGGAQGRWVLQGVGVVPALTLVDNSTAAAANAEVLGIPTELGNFVRPASAWMQDAGPMHEKLQSLLRVEAEVATAIGEGQPMVFRTVVEIDEGVIGDDGEGLGWRATADRWAAALRDELRRKRAVKQAYAEQLKHARALALELLGNRVPLSIYTLKQLRDVADPMRACYQSLVRIQRAMHDVLDLREIETPLTLRLHEYPTNPMVRLLGLVSKEMPGAGPGITHAIQPIRPFWLRANIDEALGERIMHCAGGEWRRPDGDEVVPGSWFQDRTPISVGGDVNAMLDLGDPRRLSKRVHDWQSGRASGAVRAPIAHEDAERAADVVDPQVVIETLLSREWGNWDLDARWRKARTELESRLGVALSGVPESGFAAAERAFLDDAADEMLQRPGRQRDSSRTDGAMRAQHKRLAEHLARLEDLWTALAPRLAGGEPPADLEAMLAPLREVIDQVADCPVVGDADSPDARVTYSPQDAQARMHEIARDELRVDDSVAALTAACREAIGLARDRKHLQHLAMLNLLSKAWQKPDFVIRRDAAGPDEDRLFPRAESWDAEWYAGPASWGQAAADAGPGS